VRKPHRYVQTAIGMCGHVVSTWPLVQPIGGKPEVVCDECTEAKWKVGPSDGLSVWVAIDKDPSESDEDSPETTAVKKATRKSPPKPRKKAEPMCSICRRKGHIYSACPLLVGQTTIPMPGE